MSRWFMPKNTCGASVYVSSENGHGPVPPPLYTDPHPCTVAFSCAFPSDQHQDCWICRPPAQWELWPCPHSHSCPGWHGAHHCVLLQQSWLRAITTMNNQPGNFTLCGCYPLEFTDGLQKSFQNQVAVLINLAATAMIWFALMRFEHVSNENEMMIGRTLQSCIP